MVILMIATLMSGDRLRLCAGLTAIIAFMLKIGG
jgi:hypothetical protein